jgi:two-component sensor histidine kinase
VTTASPTDSQFPALGEAARTTLLPPVAQSSLAARNFARDVLNDWRIPTVYEVAVIASELVTNALLHTVGTITLSLDLQDNAVRIVCDDDNSDAIPIRRGNLRRAEDGRGLVLVAALAFDWGVENKNGVKTVWADVALKRPDALYLCRSPV